MYSFTAVYSIYINKEIESNIKHINDILLTAPTRIVYDCHPLIKHILVNIKFIIKAMSTM